MRQNIKDKCYYNVYFVQVYFNSFQFASLNPNHLLKILILLNIS
jgi:hypothetical protein